MLIRLGRVDLRTRLDTEEVMYYVSCSGVKVEGGERWGGTMLPRSALASLTTG
jgi:hypothetical protein